MGAHRAVAGISGGSLAHTLSLSSRKLGEFASTPSHISSLVAESLILQKRLSKISDELGEEHHLSPGPNLGTSDGLGSLSLWLLPLNLSMPERDYQIHRR